MSCTDAASNQVYVSLLDWFMRFGVVHQGVTDQGTHVKSQVIEKLQPALGVQHHYTTAYTPWANGTVEVVNRKVLRSVKAVIASAGCSYQIGCASCQ